MAAEGKRKTAYHNNNNYSTKGKKRKYLPHGRPVRKGLYPLRPGVEGFFITCDGGREHQATREALNLLDTFYEELVFGKNSGSGHQTAPTKCLNTIIKFKDSDSSSDENDESSEEEDLGEKKNEEEGKLNADTNEENDNKNHESKKESEESEEHADEREGSPSKRQHVETEAPKSRCTDSEASNSIDKGSSEVKDRPIDELIDEELKELGDRNKASTAEAFFKPRFRLQWSCLYSNAQKNGDPSPTSIVQHMMTSAASTKKHMSRFILRIIPAEVSCYASEEEIKRAIKPLIDQYYPTDAPTPQKFAVLYEARANSGIDRMTIINAVAKCVPQPHKVDLTNPDKTIIVQIAKTICLLGVVERYKELAKYNLRQLTSPQANNCSRT